MGNSNSDPSASSLSNGVDRESTAPSSFSISQEPLMHGEAEAVVQKYVAAPEDDATPVAHDSTERPAFEDLGELPSSYEEDRLFLVARDPRWLFSYWDFDWTRQPASTMRDGIARFFLKIDSTAGQHETTVEIQPEARNWYVPVGKPDTTYTAEIGCYAKDGSWISLVKSEPARTPADELAHDGASAFATVPMQLSFQHMVELVEEQMASGESLLEAVARITGEGRKIAFGAGSAPDWTDEQRALLAALLGHSLVDRIGLGSAEIDQLIRKELQSRLSSEGASGLSGHFMTFSADTAPTSLFSGSSFGVGSSWSAQPFSTKRDRAFFMHVNAEIIFYGGTHPDATVWIEGKKIQLSPDGTFRYHFTLPDGDFSIPIVAESADQVEQRSATLSFARGTARAGEVGSTGQPADLDPLIGKR
jgi:hypothetical protein